jgi:hypothetical protein
MWTMVDDGARRIHTLNWDDASCPQSTALITSTTLLPDLYFHDKRKRK